MYKHMLYDEYIYVKMIRDIFVNVCVQKASSVTLELDYGARIVSFDPESPSVTDQFVMKIPPTLLMENLMDMLLLHFRRLGVFTETEILAKFPTWTIDSTMIYHSKGLVVASCISTTTMKAVRGVQPSDSEPAQKRGRREG